MEHTSPTVREGVAAGEPVLRRLRDLLPEIRERYHVVDVSVFGSRVRADATSRSDLDLLVTFDSEASLFDLVGLELDLGARLGVHVDVVTPSSIKPRIRDRILETAVPVLPSRLSSTRRNGGERA